MSLERTIDISKDLPATISIIAEKSVESEKSSRILRKQTLYSTVLDTYANSTRNSTAQISYLETLERAISLFRVTARDLREYMDVRTLQNRMGAQNTQSSGKESNQLAHEIADAIMMSNRYALAFAGHVGLSILDLSRNDTISMVSFGKDETTTDMDALSFRLSKLVEEEILNQSRDTKAASGKVDDDHFKNVMQTMFTTWINQFNWNTFKDVAAARGVEDLVLKYDNSKIKRGEFSKGSSTVIVEPGVLNVRPKDVIGYSGIEQPLESLMTGVIGWDANLGNPHDVPLGVAIFSSPGAGKTHTICAYMQDAADSARDAGKSIWIRRLSITDFGSKYQNETPVRLKALCDKAEAFPGPVIWYISDVDALIASRQHDELSTEQEKELGVWFQLLDGTLLSRGKNLIIGDMNHIEGIDEAMRDRLFETVFNMERWKKPEYFAQYAKYLLEKSGPLPQVSEESWNRIGEYLLNPSEWKGELPSNRMISHALRGSNRPQLLPKSLRVASYDHRVAYERKFRNDITEVTILEKLQTYFQSRQDIEDASYSRHLKAKADKFLTDIMTPLAHGPAQDHM